MRAATLSILCSLVALPACNSAVAPSETPGHSRGEQAESLTDAERTLACEAIEAGVGREFDTENCVQTASFSLAGSRYSESLHDATGAPLLIARQVTESTTLGYEITVSLERTYHEGHDTLAWRATFVDHRVESFEARCSEADYETCIDEIVKTESELYLEEMEADEVPLGLQCAIDRDVQRFDSDGYEPGLVRPTPRVHRVMGEGLLQGYITSLYSDGDGDAGRSLIYSPSFQRVSAHPWSR